MAPLGQRMCRPSGGGSKSRGSAISIRSGSTWTVAELSTVSLNTDIAFGTDSGFSAGRSYYRMISSFFDIDASRSENLLD